MRHDLVKVPAEDRRQVAQVVNGTEYRAKDGYFMMAPEHVGGHLRHGNQPTPAAADPVRRRHGYRCTNPECGFRPFFTSCSRCGGPAVREA